VTQRERDIVERDHSRGADLRAGIEEWLQELPPPEHRDSFEEGQARALSLVLAFLPADQPVPTLTDRQAILPTPEPLDVRETRLFVSAEDIEAALTRLHGPVTRDESIVMAAAQAAADALRGSRIVAARLAAEGSTPDPEETK
jgi:hypothetical protein